MSPYPTHDIELLKQMVQNLEMFQARLSTDIPLHEKQITAAAIVELKNHIAIKTRDVKRRLRESWDY